MRIKLKNKPLYMENDEIELLAMQRLRNNKGKLNDKNVDCFVNGYNTCQLALFEIDNIIDILEYHREKCDNVKVLIDDSIHYGDLRRGYTQEEYTRIKRAKRISSAIRNFIDTLKDVRDEQRTTINDRGVLGKLSIKHRKILRRNYIRRSKVYHRGQARKRYL